MPTYDPLVFTQPNNKLSQIAQAERAKLFPKNNYKDESNEYTAVNPDALANGDLYGKGTGGDLDTNNRAAGSSVDVLERNSSVIRNPYKPNNPYTTPSA